jgi:hypothetical protein
MQLIKLTFSFGRMALQAAQSWMGPDLQIGLRIQGNDLKNPRRNVA